MPSRNTHSCHCLGRLAEKQTNHICVFRMPDLLTEICLGNGRLGTGRSYGMENGRGVHRNRAGFRGANPYRPFAAQIAVRAGKIRVGKGR